jgi:hypothetical protein
LRIVSTVALVDIGALDLAPREFLGLVDDITLGVTSCAVTAAFIDQPTTRRKNRSTTAAT